MKKKIVIVTRQLIMGGIEKSLISMLESIDKEKYDITLLVMHNGGELFADVPSWVKVRCLYGHEKSTVEKVINSIKQRNILRALKIIYYTVLSRLCNSSFKQDFYYSKTIPIEKDVYDVAIAYHVPASFPVMYVCNNLKSRKRVAWIHSDVSNYRDHIKLYSDYYEQFDKILCVSKYSLKRFLDIYPNLYNKTDVFYNIIPKNKIVNLAENNNGFEDEFYGTRILTVGRLTEEKGQELIIEVLNRLDKDGYKVKWYCIGDGNMKSKIEQKIKDYKLEETCILLGTKLNPYPYIKQCDIYIQSSKHEGYCITLAEARIFNKAIVTTNFISASEHITNYKTGLIVEYNKDELYRAIKKLLDDKYLKERFEQNLKYENANNITNGKNLEDLVLNI